MEKRTSVFLFVALLFAISAITGCQKNIEGSLEDSRDGKVYKTVKIGEQTWMAENLAYKTEDSYCYDDKEENCTKYGRLYAWDDAYVACPSGWHLPSKKELKALSRAWFSAGKKLKSRDGWNEDGNGTDNYGFSALPGGGRSEIGPHIRYSLEGKKASFWSSTEYYVDASYYMTLYFKSGSVRFDDYIDKNNAFSVRCIKDDEAYSSKIAQQRNDSLPIVPTSTLTDPRDGKTYRTVVIGSRTWMAENLNYEMEKSFCYKDKKSGCTKFGRLYEWEAALQACPDGWYLPRKREFESLIEIAGGTKTGGKNIKSRIGWNGRGNGLDSTGFAALPGGHMFYYGNFIGRGGEADFWTSTMKGNDRAYYMGLFFNESANIFYDFVTFNARSVRCIKKLESDSVARLPKSVVVDSRDGKIYIAVDIGKQTWMAENLAYSAKDSYCYGDKDENCKTYGRLYTWNAAEKACLKGWHLPSRDEFETMLKTVGGDVGKRLKAGEKWEMDGNGLDVVGFSALPGGYWNKNSDSLGLNARFWTSSKILDTLAYFLSLGYGYDYAILNNGDAAYGYSVRCVKD